MPDRLAPPGTQLSRAIRSHDPLALKGWRTLKTFRCAGMLLTDDVHAPRFRLDWHTHPHPGCTFTVRGGYRERTASAEFACEPGMWMLKPGETRHVDQYGAEPTRSLHLMFLAGARPELDRGIGRSLGVRLLERGSAPRIGRRLVRELSVDDAATDLSVEALLLELSALLCRAGGRAPIPGG